MLAGLSAGVALSMSGCAVVQDYALQILDGKTPQPTPEIEDMGDIEYVPDDNPGGEKFTDIEWMGEVPEMIPVEETTDDGGV